MIFTAGIDVGSTYTKAVILGAEPEIDGHIVWQNERRASLTLSLGDGLKVVSRAINSTGFKLSEIARVTYEGALKKAGLNANDVSYIVATGFGRHMVDFGDLAVTDLTASARGASFLFPATRTILDVGGQSMKASRLDVNAKVKSFRLNDKCAAGTGAFLEKTARYMGFSTEEIGPLAATSKQAVPISGVCAVFAESEVINQLSLGASPADIMHGAISSLVDRSLQLMKRVQMAPAFTLIGGILRFETMARLVREHLTAEVNIPSGDMVQFTTALGAAILARQRLSKLSGNGDWQRSSSLTRRAGLASSGAPR